MFGATLILLGSFALGFFALSLLRCTTTPLEKVTLSAGIGLVLGMWLALLVTLIFGASFVPVVFALPAAALFTQLKHPLSLTKVSLSALIFLIFISAVSVPLYRSHNLAVRDGAYFSGGSAWADLGLHTTFIRLFARQEHLSLISPIYSQTQTNYPFLLNFYAAQLFKQGISLEAALTLTSCVLLILACLLWYSAVLRITKKVWVVWVSVLLFFANGGIGFIDALQDWKAQNTSLVHFLLNQPLNYTHIEPYNIYWSNVIGDIFIPQRTFVAGFLIFMLFFWFLTYLCSHSQSVEKIWFALGLLIAATPLIHTHTFLILSAAYAVLTLYFLVTRQLELKPVVIRLFLILALTLPQYAWQIMHTTSTESFISVKPGWYTPAGTSILAFWIRNMGANLIFLIMSLFWLFRTLRHKTTLKLFLLTVISFFFICNGIQFQPFLFDNMKFMVFSHWAVSLTIALLLAELHLTRAIFIWALIPFAVASGVLSIIRESTLTWEMASATSVQESKKIAALLPPNAVVLTGDYHLHPVPFLVGNPVVLGYRGWLWSHGYTYTETESDVKELFAGSQRAEELFKKHSVSFVYISDLEKKQYFVNESFYKETYPTIFQSDTATIYAVSEKLSNSGN